MTALWQSVGVVLTAMVLFVLAALVITEFIGARVPGFTTISEAAQKAAAKGDYRLFAAVLILFCLAAIWWVFHILLPI